LHRESTCTFPSLPGLTRTAALKSEVSQLRNNSNNLLGLYRQLRDGSAVEAWNLLERIRSGQIPIDTPPRDVVSESIFHKTPSRPSRLVDALDIATNRPSRRSSLAASSFPSGATQKSHVTKRYPVSRRPFKKTDNKVTAAEAQYTTTEQKGDIPLPYQPFELLQHDSGFHGEPHTNATLQLSLRRNLQSIQQGFQVQQSCISEVFFCHSQETFESLILCLKPGYVATPRSSVLCEICAVTIIAGQYVRDSLELGLLDHWYSRSKLQQGSIDH